MIRALGLALLVGLAACGDDTFEAPPQPDLYKVPYDFAVPGRDGGAKDAGVPDLSGEMPDLTAETPDLTTSD